MATCVLIAIVKKELQLDASLYTCLQILSVSVFEKTEISRALQAHALQIDMLDTANLSALRHVVGKSLQNAGLRGRVTCNCQSRV